MAWTADARWLGLLAEYLVKTSAVLFLALAVTGLLGRRSAALRHFILSAFLVGLVLLPLLPSLPAGWETRWLPARTAAQAAAPAVRNDGPVSTLQAGDVPAAPASWTAIPLSGGPGGELSSTAPAAMTEIAPQDTEKSPVAGFGTAMARAAKAAQKLIPVVWTAGLLLLLFRLGLGLAGAARLSLEGRPLDDSAWEALLRRFLAMVRLRRPVRLKSHGRVAIPMTWGLVRPVILFPEDSRDWEEGRRSAALFHELSHIKRADFAVMLLVRLSLALFWFNPLVWAAFRRLRREQEKACDELVLKAGIKPSSYARSLLMFRRAADSAWGPSTALLGLAAGSSLDERLAAILRQKLTFKEITMRTRIVLAIAIFSVVTLVGSARPAAQTAAAPAAAASVGAAPAPAAQAAAASQDKPQAEKQKETAKEKPAKQAVTKTVVITTSGDKPGQLKLTVSDGKETKTLILDQPVVLEAAGPADEVVLKVDGKDLTIKKGQKVTIVSKGGSLEVVGEDEIKDLGVDVHAHAVVSPVIVTVDEAHPRTVIIEDVKGKPVIITEVPAVPGVPAPAAVPAVPAPPAAPAAPPAPAKVTTYTVVENGKTYEIVMTPRANAYAPHAYSLAPAYEVGSYGKEIKSELQAIQEQVKKLEQRRPDVSNDLKAIEESLQALAEKLEKQAAKLDIYKADIKVHKAEAGVPAEGVTVAVPEEHITVVSKDAAAGEAVGVIYSDKTEKAHVVSVTRGEVGVVTVVYKTGEALKDEAAVARAVDKVKKALPQGYGLESKADKEAGALTLKIKAPEGQKDTEGVVKKVVAILVEELK